MTPIASGLPPGPPPVNNPIALVRYARALARDPIEFQRGRFATYGDTYSSHVGAISMLVTREPDHFVRVLMEDAASYQKPEAGFGAAQLRRLLGNGLVSSNGDFWREQRRQIQPAFGAAHLKSYAHTMVEYTERWIERCVEGAELDVSRQMMGLTLQIVARLLMGRDVRSERDPTPRLMQAFRDTAGGLSAMLPAWMPYPPRWREQRARDRLRRMVDELIEAHRRGDPALDAECLLAVLSGDCKSRARCRENSCAMKP
jgi:cytochrome P450